MSLLNSLKSKVYSFPSKFKTALNEELKLVDAEYAIGKILFVVLLVLISAIPLLLVTSVFGSGLIAGVLNLLILSVAFALTSVVQKALQ